MKSGETPIYRADLVRMMKKNYEAGRLSYTTDSELFTRMRMRYLLGLELRSVWMDSLDEFPQFLITKR